MAERGRRGFMLLEVLVAAVVAVVMITVLTRLAGDNWTRVEDVRTASGGMAVARSVLEEASARKALQAGETRGMAGVYRWVVAIERLGDVTPAPATSGADQETTAKDATETGPTWSLYRIDVVVTAPNGRSSTLETFRLGRIRT